VVIVADAMRIKGKYPAGDGSYQVEYLYRGFFKGIPGRLVDKQRPGLELYIGGGMIPGDQFLELRAAKKSRVLQGVRHEI